MHTSLSKFRIGFSSGECLPLLTGETMDESPGPLHGVLAYGVLTPLLFFEDCDADTEVSVVAN